ncbi:MAG: N-6 DNA methylase [Ardenticatenaceae bacterium]|nr:N-6 DNA methylase [Ardenticatenaceae bacterium]
MTVQAVIQAKQQVFGSHFPIYRNYPIALSRTQIEPLDSLLTKDSLRPRWGNLALAATRETAHMPRPKWEHAVRQQKIPTTILVSTNVYILIERLPDGSIQTTDVTNSLLPTLKRLRDELFSPQALAKFKVGQLSFADLEDDWNWSSGFAKHVREQQRQLELALAQGVQQAIAAQHATTKANIDTIFSVALGYMGARILEDKGFFGEDPLPSNDPVQLLHKTIAKTNGFFKHASNLITQLNDEAVQGLAAAMGKSVSFSLIDHRDVGRLYEHTLKTLAQLGEKKTGKWESAELLNLQQYYTPVAIARQMLAYLPLERIRPEDRVIYDPAAGSGSLLLASSQRLFAMEDVESPELVASNILGNDKDRNAELLTRLRYVLTEEALDKTGNLLQPPVYFGVQDYMTDDAWLRLPKRPRVIVANPPFGIVDKRERATTFVQSVLGRLQEGDQFACVLPGSSYTATTYGWKSAKDFLNNKTQLLETWQLPPGVVGLSAETRVTVVLGIIGESTPTFSISRSIRATAKDIRDKASREGFLGDAVATKIKTQRDWTNLASPQIQIDTFISVGDLFDVCNGVRLRNGIKRFSLDDEHFLPPKYNGLMVKAWINSWRTKGTLWADPQNAPYQERYIVYHEDFLSRMRPKRKDIFDSSKVLISRTTNSDYSDPFPVYLDTEGLYPSDNMYCLVPYNKNEIECPTPSGWQTLSRQDQLFWLVGILNNELLKRLSMVGRGNRQLLRLRLLALPLPEYVDKRIINVTSQIIEIEQKKQEGDIAKLKKQLNELVLESYGNPVLPPEANCRALADEWATECSKPKLTTVGQVLAIDGQMVEIRLGNLLDDEDTAWLPLPYNMPSWAFDGTVFTVDFPEDVSYFADLQDRPYALQNFRHTPRPYRKIDEMQVSLYAKLGIE